MKTPQVEKIDFAKTHKALYSATSKVKEITVDKAAYLSIKGVGKPGGEVFQSAIGKLYGLAYTLKFSLKFASKLDFAVSKLECLWPEDPTLLPPDKWPWQLLIRIPDAVTSGDIAKARKALMERKQLDTSDVERWVWKEGRCLQVMHIGPYEEVGSVYCELGKQAENLGLAASGPGHEIYISDPRRVPPAKLKTIIRMPVTEPKR